LGPQIADPVARVRKLALFQLARVQPLAELLFPYLTMV
jgi:hypothetical protein